MTRSGCPSAVRSTGRCPLISAKRGIGHTNSSQFRDGVNSLKRSAPNFVREGVAEDRHPLNDPTPAGATDARVGARTESGQIKARLQEFAGTGTKPVPLRADPPAGATDAGGVSPNSYQPFPSGKATKRVLSPFFTRIRTLRLPSVRAVETTSRMSAGVETDLPATSRITSPVENP